MYSAYDVQVAKGRMNEWHTTADAIRRLDEAHREQSGLARSGRALRAVSAVLTGLGGLLVRAGCWLDARTERQSMPVDGCV